MNFNFELCIITFDSTVNSLSQLEDGLSLAKSQAQNVEVITNKVNSVMQKNLLNRNITIRLFDSDNFEKNIDDYLRDFNLSDSLLILPFVAKPQILQLHHDKKMIQQPILTIGKLL